MATIATDSAAQLHDLIGDDATATFENDPKFKNSDAVGTASSDNVAVQRGEDDTEDSEEEIADADELDEEDETDEDEDEDEDLDDEAADDDDLEDDDADAEDDDEDEDEATDADKAEPTDGHADRAVDAALRMSAQ